MRTSVVVALLALAVGCKPKVQDVACSAGPIAGVTKVSWTTKREGDAHVEYGLDADHLDGASAGVPADAGEATLVGLKVATEYTVKVVVEDGGTTFESDPVECTTEPPPRSAPPFTLDVWDPDLACEDGGYVLFNWLGASGSGVGIVDRDGRLVWAVESAPDVQFARARPGRDGRSILWNTNDAEHAVDVATIERLAIDGSSSTSTRTFNGHHDFLELPDGRLAFVAYEMVEANDVGAGKTFDPASLGFPTDGPKDWDDFRLAYDRIYEIDEGAVEETEPTLVFDHLRDWPEGVYFNHTGSSFEKCSTFLRDHCELGHANSLAYVPSEDRYTIGFRWLDAIVNLDHSGAVQWVIGGPSGTLAAPQPEDLPMHDHFSEAWPGGMLLYDNRDNDPPTRLVEYAIDEAAGGFEVAWTVDKPPPEDGSAPRADTILGDLRHVPVEGCDNLLVSWASDGRLQERTRDGQIVWQVSFAAGNLTGRAQYLSSLDDFADQAYPE